MPRSSSSFDFRYAIHVDSLARCVVAYDHQDETDALTRFAVRLERRATTRSETWHPIAEVVHDPDAADGVDVYEDGITIDIFHVNETRSRIQLMAPTRETAPPPVLLHRLKTYLIGNVAYFRQTAANQIGLDSRPRFP